MSTSLMINDGRVGRTRDFYNKSNVFIGIGRSTAWTSDPTPDDADITVSEIEELIAIKRVTTKKYVRAQTGGSIIFNNAAWEEIDPNGITIQGTDISFDNATSEIRSSSTDFSLLTVGEKIKVSGTTGGTNDGEYTISVITGTDTLTVLESVTDEAAGSTITIETDIFINYCHHIFYEVELDYDQGVPDQLPVDVAFRQVGILEDPLDTGDSVCISNVYLPSSLNSQGILHYIDNRAPIYRTDLQRETIAMVLEF